MRLEIMFMLSIQWNSLSTTYMTPGPWREGSYEIFTTFTSLFSLGGDKVDVNQYIPTKSPDEDRLAISRTTADRYVWPDVWSGDLQAEKRVWSFVMLNALTDSNLSAINSYSASHDSWCTATLWNRIMTAQCEGMGEVGSARYEPALLPPCPSIRVLSCSNMQSRDPLTPADD